MPISTISPSSQPSQEVPQPAASLSTSPLPTPKIFREKKNSLPLPPLAQDVKEISGSSPQSSIEQTAQRTQDLLQPKELSSKKEANFPKSLKAYLTFLQSTKEQLSHPDLSSERKSQLLTHRLEQMPPIPQREAISNALWQESVKPLFSSLISSIAHDQSAQLTNRALAFLPLMLPEELEELLPHSQSFTFVTQAKTEEQKNLTLFLLEQEERPLDPFSHLEISSLSQKNKSTFTKGASPHQLAHILNHSSTSIGQLLAQQTKLNPFSLPNWKIEEDALNQLKEICPLLTKVNCSSIKDLHVIELIMKHLSPQKVTELNCSNCDHLPQLPHSLTEL